MHRCSYGTVHRGAKVQAVARIHLLCVCGNDFTLNFCREDFLVVSLMKMLRSAVVCFGCGGPVDLGSGNLEVLDEEGESDGRDGRV